MLIQRGAASVPAPRSGAGTTSVASSPGWAEAKCDFFGALLQLKDEALRCSRIAARCQ